MSPPVEEAARRRAERLMLWYPQSWRRRYGEEFTELLIAELSDRPHSWRLSLNLAWSGSLARLARLGFAGQTREPAEQVRLNLAWVGCALAAFLVFACTMWSQLTIGWRWSRPDTAATTAGVLVTSLSLLLLVSVTALAAAPIGWAVVTELARRKWRLLAAPSVIFAMSGGFLVAGARHFGNGWPGTGGHPWAQQGLVPGGFAAFTWASTLSVSSYWAHPLSLFAFPLAELCWMALSPIAMLALVASAATTVRRLELSPRVLRYEARLCRAACLGMIVFVLGACAWVIDGGSGPGNLFHAGAIDVAGLVVMAAAVAVARRALRRAERGALALPAG